MVCIYCSCDTKVINSRHQKRLNNIWRRRECLECGAIFTTSEAPDLLKSLLVTKNAQLEPFSRDKLFISLYDSLKHRKQATSDATGLTDTIIAKASPHITSGTISTTIILQTTISVLKHFDKAAATYYSAYHPL